MRSTSTIVALLSSIILAKGQDLDCDPCIERKDYKITAIVHGKKDDSFWQQVRAPAVQSALDMRVDFEMELYDDFNPEQMAADIVAVALGASPPDALIVTLVAPVVEEAVATAVGAGVPVFGLNSGYKAAKDIGLLGFVAMDEKRGGEVAALQMPSATNALFVNHEKGNTALDDRREGFASGLAGVPVTELEVELSSAQATMETVLAGCPYDTILLASSALVSHAIAAIQNSGCDAKHGDKLLGTFDTSPEVYDAIAAGEILFAISQQHNLQGLLPVVLASLYATTGKALALPAENEFGTLLSGPAVVNIDNLPSAEHQTCSTESFPVCPNTLAADGSEAECECTERSDIKIAGVLHGVTTDSFWDIVFAAAETAAVDMGVDLELDRPEPEESDDVVYTKMAEKIESLCEEGVSGLFVSIPSDTVIPAVEKCLELDVPVISINSGAEASSELDLMHHIGQLEYNAGFEAAGRLVDAGMAEGYCLVHEPDNSGHKERCSGFADGIAEADGATYGGIVEVPPDDDSAYVTTVLDAIRGATGPVGLLLLGPVQTAPALQVARQLVLARKSGKPDVLLGTFDLSDEIYAALDSGAIKFAVDQNAYMQGYMPVPLLTYMAYTKQALANQVVDSGPDFVDLPPSEDQQVCEQKSFKTCAENRRILSH